MNRTQLFLGIGTLLILIASITWFLSPRTAPSPLSTEFNLPLVTNNTATSSKAVATTTTSLKSSAYLFPIAQGDIIASWNYDGFLNDNGPREAEAHQKIKELESQLGKGNDSSLYLSLAQEYDHLGDGRSAYTYLSRAIALDANKTSGVEWHNMGVLMEKFGAYRTARIAHEEAVKIQPNISAFQISRVELMIYHFPKDTTGVEKAFTDAEALFGANDPMLLDLRNRWKALL